MTAKKRSKSKRINKRTNTSLAKRQKAIIKALANKEQNPPKDLTLLGKILRYKKWFPLALILSLFSFWRSCYPKKIEVMDELIGKYHPLSNAIILKNPNTYFIDDIKINCKGTIVAKGPIVNLDSVYFSKNFTVYEIPGGKSKTIRPTNLEGVELTEVEYADVTIVLSYSTPFLYPNVNNDTIGYIGILTDNGEIKYLPK